ncbi:hypothetical protein JNM87_01785, partial [Candidatus Saccharibacteria bacterium]|nr:hypothetical protein [Candidatus Saccharibacteria bacterium]
MPRATSINSFANCARLDLAQYKVLSDLCARSNLAQLAVRLTIDVSYTTVMAKSQVFIRNVAARDLLDIFVVSAASSILLIRFYLHATGYPVIGGTKYHIAHMLWGGLLMLAAFVLNFAFLGARLQKLVALMGGIGFGIFIDEIGKYVTRNNDYFFQPAV